MRIGKIGVDAKNIRLREPVEMRIGAFVLGLIALAILVSTIARDHGWSGRDYTCDSVPPEVFCGKP